MGGDETELVKWFNGSGKVPQPKWFRLKHFVYHGILGREVIVALDRDRKGMKQYGRRGKRVGEVLPRK